MPGFDAAKQRDDEIYAGYIDEWSKRCDLDHWTSWTSHLLAHGQPSIKQSSHERLRELRRWLMKRVWPRRYHSLEAALTNFGRVLQDFLRTFDEHVEERGKKSDELWTVKFYKIRDYNAVLYNELVQKYKYHVDLVEDLTLELTRAANLVCDEVRNHVAASYRMAEGRLSVMTGPHEDLSWRECVVEYDQKERAAKSPYPGLAAFLTERATRDLYFGSGPLTG